MDAALRCGHLAWWPVEPQFGKCWLCLPSGCDSEAQTASSRARAGILDQKEALTRPVASTWPFGARLGVVGWEGA